MGLRELLCFLAVRSTTFATFAKISQILNFKQKFLNFFRLIFPSTVSEIMVFAIFLTAYGILGSYIALNYRIIYDERIPWDAYFSFDNRSIVMTGGGFERHPLSNYFFDQVRNFALWISNGKKDANFRLALAWLSNVAVSLAILQIFKYLKNIIRLPLCICLLLTVFTGFFSTSILLSFTPETYTYTFLALCLFNHYAALKLRQNEKIPVVALSLAGIAVGGLTITNIIKIYIPLLFEKKIFWNWKKIGNIILRLAVSFTVFIVLYLNRLNFDVHKILSKTDEQYEKFSKPRTTPLWDMVSSWFFGGNLLFSSLTSRDYHSNAGFGYKAIFMEVYSCVFPYFFIAATLALVFWSWLKNFKNPFAQIIMISFFVDVIIHCVLKFGLHTSYIYGGHFVFIYPLMMGWLFYAYRFSPKILSSLLLCNLLILIYLLMSNWFRMQEFFVFLDKFYQ